MNIEEQRELIHSALKYLAGHCDGAREQDGAGFNAMDAYEGHLLAEIERLEPDETYKAYKLLRKYWRQLKPVNLMMPKTYQHEYWASEVEGGIIVSNLAKDTQYILEWISDDELSCTCEAYSHGHVCKHILYAHSVLESSQEPTEPTPQPIAPITEVTDTEKEILPGIFATPEQAIALDELLEFARGGKAVHGLFGFAGTGKTVLLQAWIKALRDSGYDLPIVFTAPTNKAVQVLQGMVDKWRLGIECQTCAKLLGLKPKIDPKNGEQYFDVDYGEENSIRDYAIVVADESSMIGSAQTHKGLWEHITESAGLLTKLLFVGDYAQLPPVNEPISKVFLEVQEPSQLTQVKRYRGAIAAIASDIRENLGRKSEPFFQSDYTADGHEGLFVLNRASWEATCIRAFSSEKYLLDPNYVRCLAWTNKRVRELNATIRQATKQTRDRFVEGERLIATTHFHPEDRKDQQPIFTSQEMEVEEVMVGSMDGFECYYLTVQLFDRAGTRLIIPVLHENSWDEFKADQDDLKKNKQWPLFYSKKEQFCWVDYAYAVTVHKSQGSTFHNVFVDVPDIMRNGTRNKFTWPNGESQIIWERNQLLYVALTRASHKVLLFE